MCSRTSPRITMLEQVNKLAGFTLIELMVTISILAILISIAAPAFNQIIANQRVRAAASELQTALLLARSEAIKRNQNVIISRKDDAWSNGWSVNVGGNSIHEQGSLNDLVITPSVATIQISYRPSGRSTDLVDFELTSGSVLSAPARCVRLEVSGQPTIRAGGCS